jgi:hypothetical protein
MFGLRFMPVYAKYEIKGRWKVLLMVFLCKRANIRVLFIGIVDVCAGVCVCVFCVCVVW